MLTQDEKVLKVFQQIPFVAASYRKIVDALKDELSAEEVYLVLGSLVSEGKINMVINSKGDPEYSIKWNPQVDEERKLISREFNKRFDEKTIFFPRYEGYVANLQDNFCGDYGEFLEAHKELNAEYAMWHRNAKSGVVYPPKLHSLSSANVLVFNVLAGLDLDPAQVSYANEFEVIAAEPMRDRPDEISAPKVQFDAIVNYADAIDFVQANYLEHFFAPFRQSMWAYQAGTRYLFDDENAINLWKAFSRKANYVYVDGYAILKSLVAIYSDVLAEPENYAGKKVTLLNIGFNVKTDSEFKALAEFQVAYDEEMKRVEAQFNEFLATLPLPEGTTLNYQYLTVEEVAEDLSDNVKEYIKNRYVGF